MPDEITYHKLTSDNAHLLMNAEAFDYAVIPQQLEAFVDEPSHVLVFATDGEDVVGIASGSMLLHPDKQPIFFVAEVGVDEEYRRRGIAHTLVTHILTIARKSGSKGIWLATEEDNVEARGLYQKLEARETGGIVVYDWDGAMDD